MQGHQTGSKWLPGPQVLIVTSTKELPDLNNKFVSQEGGWGVMLSNQNECENAPRTVGKKKVTRVVSLKFHRILPQFSHAECPLGIFGAQECLIHSPSKYSGKEVGVSHALTNHSPWVVLLGVPKTCPPMFLTTFMGVPEKPHILVHQVFPTYLWAVPGAHR